MDWAPIGFFVIVVLVILGVVIGAIIADKRRTEAIKQLADSLGLAFQQQTSVEQLEMFKQISYFSQGRSHQIRNLLSGSTDVTAIYILDFHYTVGSGKNSSTKRQTVVALASNELEVPGFDLAPESIFSRFTEWFGVQDIDFESHPEFSDKFILQATDEEAVRRFLDRPLLDFLIQKPDIYLNVRRGFLCVYRPDQLAAPEKWKERMAEGFEIYRELLNRISR